MGRCGDCCTKFGLILYNPSKKTFCGRTCTSWALILIYFAIYYTLLVAFWVGMLSAFLYGLVDEKVPTLTGYQSLLKLNPGLGFLPPINPDGPLLQIPIFDSKDKTKYLETMNAILSKYDQNESNCDFTTGTRTDDFRTPCRFPKSLLGNCSSPKDVIDTEKNICIYMALNRIYGYLPPVTGTKIEITCGPANSFDAENLEKAHFYPNTGNSEIGYFSTVAFPYLNQPTYQQPLLAVMFPNIKRNTIVMVECKIINLKNEETFRFDLVVDAVKSRSLNT